MLQTKLGLLFISLPPSPQLFIAGLDVETPLKQVVFIRFWRCTVLASAVKEVSATTNDIGGGTMSLFLTDKDISWFKRYVTAIKELSEYH